MRHTVGLRLPSHPSPSRLLSLLLLLTSFHTSIQACDLCAIYGANDGRSLNQAGWSFALSEQFIPFHKLQSNGEPLDSIFVGEPYSDRLDRSITHLVPGYSFNERWSINLGLPIIHRDFQRNGKRYQVTPFPLETDVLEKKHETEIGDMTLIGRWVMLDRSGMKKSAIISLLGGFKLPTGPSHRLADEVDQARLYDLYAGPGHVHDALGDPVSGIHQHDLTSGSGSVDGIIGITANLRWHRYFYNQQVQYYIRTYGRAEYRFANDLMISGGPGAYLLTHKLTTLSLQCLASYETKGRDIILDKPSSHTGMTAWYVGPNVVATFGGNLGIQAALDIPLDVIHRGLQNVPDWRFHGGINLRF